MGGFIDILWAERGLDSLLTHAAQPHVFPFCKGGIFLPIAQGGLLISVIPAKAGMTVKLLLCHSAQQVNWKPRAEMT